MAESVDTGSRSLQELFKEGWESQKRIDSDDLSSTSEEYQACVRRGIKCLEQTTHLANQLGMFSSNESIEDVATADIRYLLIPALLGDLTLQSCDDNRLDVIQKSRIYFVDYLQRCKSYSVTNEDCPVRQDHTSSASDPTPSSKVVTFEELAAERSAKIARLKEKKEVERRLKELMVRVELSMVSQRHQVEDEVLREQATTLLHFWVYRSQDLICSIDQESDMLEAMEKRGVANGREATPHEPPPKLIKPVKPIVITKEMIQSKVFGAGYPSLPLMSVEEFYQQKYKEEMEQRKAATMFETRVVDDGMVGGSRGRKGSETMEVEGEEEEEEEKDEDSEEALKKARDWDEFKDDNRTGWGNKKNMG